MSLFVVDTNVPIVANGRADDDERQPSLECREHAVRFLMHLRARGKVVVDLGGEIQSEYLRYLNPKGAPGVGDRFLLEILNSHPNRVERIEIKLREDGEFEDLPEVVRTSAFDPSDRKFAAVGFARNCPVANACDSDWLIHRNILEAAGLRINFICSGDSSRWFS